MLELTIIYLTKWSWHVVLMYLWREQILSWFDMHCGTIVGLIQLSTFSSLHIKFTGVNSRVVKTGEMIMNMISISQGSLSKTALWRQGKGSGSRSQIKDEIVGDEIYNSYRILNTTDRSDWKTDLVSNRTQTRENILSEGNEAADRISPIHTRWSFNSTKALDLKTCQVR